MSESTTPVFYLQHRNKYLSTDGGFTVPGFGHPSARRFDSQEAALDEAIALGKSLDDVRVIRSTNSRTL